MTQRAAGAFDVKVTPQKPDTQIARAANLGRLTIDTPEDLAFIEALHERMDPKAGEASLADLLLLLEREPALRETNAHVRQKELGPTGGLALIRYPSLVEHRSAWPGLLIVLIAAAVGAPIFSILGGAAVLLFMRDGVTPEKALDRPLQA